MMRVLVLSDEPDAALLRVLQGIGATPLVARTEEEAVVHVHVGVDAAIIDVQRKPNRYGGISFIRYLRVHLGQDVPLILFMSHFDAGARLECERLCVRCVVGPGPTTASVADYLRKSLPASTRTRSGMRTNATKDSITGACELWRERYGLSTMETAVLEEAARGRTRTEIALKMRLSPETVKTHARNLIAKSQDESLASAGARLVREIVELATILKGESG